MISNGPSRTFTRDAVEAWLVRLSTCDWEKHIPESQLKLARNYYRDGYLSTLDLQENQAIVTKKINREETYSVVEWSRNNAPEIRTSMDDEQLGVVLATAGLYEIEELIAEIQEDDPLLGENISLPDETEQEEDDEADKKEDADSTDESSQKIPLVISLEVSNQQGLRAIPSWKLSSDRKVSVYGDHDSFDSEQTDRPALMRFVAEAGKQGFTFNKKSGEFRIQDWSTVAKFTQDVLRVWENSFLLEFSESAKLLKKGLNTLNWEIEARSLDGSDMLLRENFHLGKRRLSPQLVKKVTSARLGSTFIRGHGLVRLDQDQVEDFTWWQRNRGDAKRAHWPRYMLFSLFARKY